MLIVDNLSVIKHWPGVHKGHTMYQCRIAMYVSLQDENKVPVLQAMAHLPNKQIM